MQLGTEISLGPGHILDADPTQPPLPQKTRGTASQFSAHVYCGQTIAISATAKHLLYLMCTVHRIALKCNNMSRVDYRELQPGEWAMSPYGNALYMSPEITGGRSHNSKVINASNYNSASRY